MRTTRIWRHWTVWLGLVLSIPALLLIVYSIGSLDRGDAPARLAEGIRDQQVERLGPPDDRYLDILIRVTEQNETDNGFRLNEMPPALAANSTNWGVVETGLYDRFLPLLDEWESLRASGTHIHLLYWTDRLDYLAIQNATKLLQRQALLEHARGNSDAALDYAYRSAAFTDPTAEGTFLIGHLIAVASRNIGYTTYELFLFEEQSRQMLSMGLEDLRELKQTEPELHDSVIAGEHLWTHLVYAQQSRINMEPSLSRWVSLKMSMWPGDLALASQVLARLREGDLSSLSEDLLQSGTMDTPPYGFTWTSNVALMSRAGDILENHGGDLSAIVGFDPPIVDATARDYLLYLRDSGFLYQPNSLETRLGVRESVMSDRNALLQAAYRYRLDSALLGEVEQPVDTPAIIPWPPDAGDAPVVRIAVRPLAPEMFDEWIGDLTMSIGDHAVLRANDRDPRRPSYAFTVNPSRGGNPTRVFGDPPFMGRRIQVVAIKGLADAMSRWTSVDDEPVGSVCMETTDSPADDCAWEPLSLELAQRIAEGADIDPAPEDTTDYGAIERFELSVPIAFPSEVVTIWSNGPDGDDDDGRVIYDPTNGTVSNGDLVIWPEPR